MKRFAKLLVVPVAFLAMAGLKAADAEYTIAINGDTINYTGLKTTNGIAGTYKYNLADLTSASVAGVAVPANVASPASAYATCTMAVTKAYEAPVYCTKGESFSATEGQPCYTTTTEKKAEGSSELNDIVKTEEVTGTATCTITNITIPAGTASDTNAVLLFGADNHQATYTITMGDYSKLNVAVGKTVDVKSITMGKYSQVTVAGTLKGDLRTAGAYVNNAGNYSGTITYDTVGAPAAPVKQGAVVDNKVTLRITNVLGAKSYTLYRATTADGSYSAIKSDIAAEAGEYTEYIDKTLENGKSYYYKVAAKGANSKLSDKSAASAVVKNGVATPETLTVKAASYNSATVTAGKVSGATGYLFYRALSTTPNAWVLVKSQSSNVYTDKDLVPGQEYHYTVAAYVSVNSVKNYSKAFGNVEFGDDNADMGNENVTKAGLVVDTQFKAVTTKLDKPSISKIAVSSTNGKLKVTINKVTGATGYVVFKDGAETCRTEGTTCTTSVVTIGNLNTFTVVAYKGAAPAANFTHTALTALGGVGVSALSAEKTYTLKPGAPKISTSNVKLLEEGDAGYYSTVVVTVTKFETAGGEPVEYVLYRSTKKNGTYSKLDVAPVAADDTVLRKFIVDDLKPGKTYYFKAKVKVNGTLSDASNVVSKETKMTPYTKNTDLIKKLTAVADGNKKITLTLTDATEGATGYAIYRATKSSGTYKLVKTILIEDVDNPAEITYTNKKLTVGQKYYYKVRAFRSVDGKKVYGKYSSKVSATATLEAPTELEKTDSTKKTITLAWEKVSGANGYRVYNSDDEIVATTTKASATIKGLDSNTEYTFYVRAYANVGGKKKLGAKSENFSASTEAAE